MKIKQLLKKYLLRSRASSGFGGQNERRRIDWIKETLKGIPQGSKILDAGAGEQPFKKYCQHLDYVAQDFAQYDPNKLSAGLQMANWDYGDLDIVSDITEIPVPDKSFDALLSTEVFEHIVNPIEAVKEFSRILRKGGYLLITAPFCSLTHFAPYHFYSGFNRYFYEKVLAEEGFEKIEITSNGNYFEYLAQELHRLPTIAHTYSALDLNKTEQKSVKKLKNLLQKLSENEKHSSELLCFGYFILARKI